MVSADPPGPGHTMRIVDDELVIDDSIASHAPGADTTLLAEDVKSMLCDDEALEGVEAWLSRQQPRIALGPRDRERAGELYVETPAGWLFRLVRHARCALAAGARGASG